MTTQQFESQLDRLTTDLLVPLRTDKLLVVEHLDSLCELVATARRAGLFGDLIELRLVGKLWYVFCAFLTEADHARDPDPILNAAWRYQEELRRTFGPTF